MANTTEEKWARRKCAVLKEEVREDSLREQICAKTWRRWGAHSALNSRQSQGKRTGAEDRVVVVMLLMVMMVMAVMT